MDIMKKPKISLKGIKGNTWQENLAQLKILIRELYNEFEYIREVLNESELKVFDNIWLGEINGEYTNSLKNLTAFLYK